MWFLKEITAVFMVINNSREVTTRFYAITFILCFTSPPLNFGPRWSEGAS
eukprot:SAG11_NODE_31186_length_294_cov_0.564103_1_plen_49_part_10